MPSSPPPATAAPPGRPSPRTAIGWLLVAATAIAAGAAPRTVGVDSSVDRAWRHVEAAVAGGLRPVDFHHLVLAVADDDLFADWTAGQAMLDRLAAVHRADPLMADEVRLLAARRDLAAGRPAAARERFRTMGGLERWWAAGPEPINELEDFVRRAAPTVAELTWRRAYGTDPLGWVRVAGLAWPAHRQQLLLATTLHSEREQPVAIRLGASQAAKVWLNGEPVLTTPFPLAHAADQAAGGGQLRRGRNLLLIAVASESDDWWLRARLTAPDGAPLAAPVRELDTAPEPIAPADGRPPTVRTLEHELRAAVADGRDGAATALAAFLVDRQPQAVGSGDARAACRAARQESPGEARLLEWRLASDPATARDLLSEAIAAEPDLHSARIRLAGWLLDRGLLEQALELLEPALDEPAVRAAALDAESSLWGGLPLPRLRTVVDEAPGCLYAAGLLVERALDGHRFDLARAALEHLETLAPGTPHTVDLRLRLADACSDGATARAIHERLVGLDPNRPGVRVRLARLRAADGDLDGARQVLQAGLDRCPDEVELLLELARVERSGGDDEAAVRLARRVLVLRPQERRALRLLDLLGAGADDRDWLRSADELRTMAAADGGAEPAVALLEHTEVEILPGQLSEERVQRAYLVRDAARGDRVRTHTLPWVPESQQLRVLSARVLRRDGRELSARQQDTPRLAEPELNIYYDTRLRVLEMPTLEDGDIVELSWILSETAESNETGPYKGGLIQIGRPVPVRLAEIELHAPADQLPAYELAHLDGTPERREQADGTVVLAWRWRDVPAVPEEVPAPPPLLVTPHLVYSNHPDWGELAEWFTRHIAARVRASRQVEELADRLTAGVDDRLQRIARIYRYVADDIRYVGLEFGEHRFRPFSADWVLDHRIGDCKDTAALLVALFNAAGIPARFVMARTADQGPVATEIGFLEAFNHAIAYLPDDDLWLDGTASGHAAYPPPGMDQGAWVLVLDGRDSRPRTTPSPGSGVATSAWHLARAEDGQVAITIRTEDTGEAADLRRHQLGGSQDPRRIARWVQARFAGADVTATPTLELVSGKDPAVVEITATAPRAALLGRGGVATFPGVFDWPAVPSDNRRTPLQVPLRPELTWTLTVELGRPPAALPPDVTRQTPFGSLTIEHLPQSSGYEVRGSLRLAAGLVEPADADALRDFLVAAQRDLERPLESP